MRSTPQQHEIREISGRNFALSRLPENDRFWDASAAVVVEVRPLMTTPSDRKTPPLTDQIHTAAVLDRMAFETPRLRDSVMPLIIRKGNSQQDAERRSRPRWYGIRMGDGEMVAVSDAAAQLGIPEVELHTLIQAGDIRAVLYLGHIRISQTELDRYSRSR